MFGRRRDGEQDAPRTRKLGSLRDSRWYAAEDMLRVGARVSRNDRSGGYTTGAADNPRPIRGRMASDGMNCPSGLQPTDLRECVCVV